MQGWIILQITCGTNRNMSETRANTNSLDLGCGVKPRNPFECKNSYGLDLRDLEIENVVQADVVLDPIPFDDSFFDGISAFDFIEHIQRVLYAPGLRFPFVELMNEIHRLPQKRRSFCLFYAVLSQPSGFSRPHAR